MQDYDSPCLKTKKHWLSFTSPDFFLDVDRVLEQMEKAGASGNESEYVLHYSEAVKLQLLKGPLRCHSCGLEAGGMEQLKIHIRRCGGGDCTGGGW